MATATMDIQRTFFSVADFVSWMKAGALDLSPSFQRRPVWKPNAKSYLIDTVVRGLPTPIIFIRQITDTATLRTVREVVDGQQRIRTLLSYIDGRMLPDYNPERDDFTVSRIHNPELSRKKFSELPDRLKRAILDYPFSTHILPTDTTDQQVLDIFRRMNATGTKLNKQELRNAEFFGEFISSVYELSLACLDLWRKWMVFGEGNIARMEEAEFLSEIYVMILGGGVSEKSHPKINSFYARYDENFPERKILQDRVLYIMNTIDESFGREMVFSPLSNKIILYCVISAIYDKIYGFGSSLTAASKRTKIDDLSAKLASISVRFDAREDLPDDVQEALLSRSNRRTNRLALTRFIEQRL